MAVPGQVGNFTRPVLEKKKKKKEGLGMQGSSRVPPVQSPVPKIVIIQYAILLMLYHRSYVVTVQTEVLL